MNILIAEDDPVSSKVISSHLCGYGKCEICGDGADAFEQFQRAWEQNRPFDLVCLDVVMPGLSGIEVLELIREFEKVNEIPSTHKAKIIIATGTGDSVSFMKAHNAGSTWFLVKPVDKKALQALMSDLGFSVL